MPAFAVAAGSRLAQSDPCRDEGYWERPITPKTVITITRAMNTPSIFGSVLRNFDTVQIPEYSNLIPWVLFRMTKGITVLQHWLHSHAQKHNTIP
jgi:hypothetical protein